METFEQFGAHAKAIGYPVVLERQWASGAVIEEHTHPFDVQALVVQGEMWLTCGDETKHLHAGDRFALQRETPHAERYGSEGATYWAARRE